MNELLIKIIISCGLIYFSVSFLAIKDLIENWIENYKKDNLKNLKYNKELGFYICKN